MLIRSEQESKKKKRDDLGDKYKLNLHIKPPANLQ